MFSVDNFYTIFNSYYGRPEKNNILRVFAPHGSKDWNDTATFGIMPSDFKDQLSYAELFCNGTFLMHDQEPFFLSALTDLKNRIQDPVYLEQVEKLKPNWRGFFRSLHHMERYINEHEMAHQFVKTTKVPIICHSEKNSSDIRSLTENHWIECYYWWHGMIARDWFRHWERHCNLTVSNKARVKYRFLIYSRDHSGSRAYRSKIIKHLQKHQSQINYNWDNNDRCATLSASIDVDDANNSAIQLVAETLFDTDKIYLTEKVFKPMVMCQPFILFSAPGSLDYLRDYGFKTFDHVWSEEYDTIADASQRKKAVLDLVDSIAAMPAEQFEQLYQELLPIVEHNRKHFYSIEFQDLLWNELQKNCSDALQKQQELSEQLPGGTYFYYTNQILDKIPFVEQFWCDTIPPIIEKYYNKDDIIKKYPALAKLFKNN